MLRLRLFIPLSFIPLSFILFCVCLAQVHNPERGDVRVLILGDFNGAYGSLNYPQALERVLETSIHSWQPDLLVSAGDLIAGQSHDLAEARFAQMWAAFDATVTQPLRAAGIPYAFALGNHDGSSLTNANGYVFERERVAARTYWQEHEALAYQSRSDFPFNYSFMFGDVFFVVWDASSAVITAAGRDWLTNELSRPAARSARLRVLVGHLPLYGVGEGKNKAGEVLNDAAELHAQLERLGVELYISGHHAAYYPAKVGALTLLHSGGIGPRRLVGDDAAPRSTVTLLDIDSAGTFELTTFDATSFEQVALESLPERLDGLNGPLWRMDKAPTRP